MARLRKAGRVWRRPEARAAAARVMADADGPLFTVDPPALFGRAVALEVELGAGRGEFIVEYAARFPERNFLAVEAAAAVARMMAVRAGRSELANLRVVQMDARPLVNLMLSDHSVSAYHVYFPDPWPKERHLKHRLFTPYFVANLRRTLVPGAAVFVATDLAEYAEAIFAMMREGGFERASLAAPGAHGTGFARKFIAQQKPIHSAAFIAGG